jgi:hypothetical protein
MRREKYCFIAQVVYDFKSKNTLYGIIVMDLEIMKKIVPKMLF